MFIIHAETAAAQELAGLTLRELRGRAAAAGVDPEELEEARDSDEPHASVSTAVFHMRTWLKSINSK